MLAAAGTGDADAVALALRDGAHLEARDASGRTALLLASSGDHVDAAQVLVAMGADPDALGDGGERRQEVARILLGAGADRSIGDHDGVTALEHAERLGFAEIAAILRSAG